MTAVPPATEASRVEPVELEQLLPPPGTCDRRVALRLGERRLTYAGLSECVDSLADELRSTAADTVVGIRVGNEPAFVVAFLACLAARRPAVLLDPLWSESELEHASRRIDVDLLLQTEATVRRSEVAQQLGAAAWIASKQGRIVTRTEAVPVARGCGDEGRGARALVDVAVVHWSSGSTGRPKPIPVTRAALAYRLSCLRRVLTLLPEDRTLCILPLSHCHGIECLALSALLGRGELVLADPMSADPTSVAAAIREHGITVFSALPRFYDQLLALAPDPGVLRSLRIPMCGSAALDPELSSEFARRFGVKIGQGYGLTEIGVVCLNLHEHEPVRFASVGRVLPGIEWRIDEPDADGIGELWLRSPGFVPAWEEAGTDTVAQGTEDGWMRTHDLVRADDEGYLTIAGRRSTFINVNGAKVDPLEIERTIQQLPWVAQCAVAGAPGERGLERVVAYVVLADGQEPDDQERVHAREEVQLHVARSLTVFKVPSRVLLLEELPRSPLGKVQYARLHESLPESDRERSDPVPPAGASEREVAELWCEVLGLESVGRQDSFMSLGGTSIGLVQMLQGFRERFGRELSIVDLFRYPTVEQQAELLSDKTSHSPLAEVARRATEQRAAMRRAGGAPPTD